LYYRTFYLRTDRALVDSQQRPDGFHAPRRSLLSRGNTLYTDRRAGVHPPGRGYAFRAAGERTTHAEHKYKNRTRLSRSLVFNFVVRHCMSPHSRNFQLHRESGAHMPGLVLWARFWQVHNSPEKLVRIVTRDARAAQQVCVCRRRWRSH